MDAPDKSFSDIANIVKSWIPWRAEPANVSRDFWMPDQSCRVCYECDSQFTVFNRRHHCRHCGRVFCAKCTTNSVPAPSSDPRTPREECEKIRVCNFCFSQWDQGLATLDNGIQFLSQDISTPSSATSVVSPKSTETANSSCITLGSMSYPVGPYQRIPYNSNLSPRQSSLTETSIERQGIDMVVSTRSNNPIASMGDPSPNQCGYFTNRFLPSSLFFMFFAQEYFAGSATSNFLLRVSFPIIQNKNKKREKKEEERNCNLFYLGMPGLLRQKASSFPIFQTNDPECFLFMTC